MTYETVMSIVGFFVPKSVGENYLQIPEIKKKVPLSCTAEIMLGN